MAKDITDDMLEKSHVFKAFKALVYNRLGINYYDSEEISESER